MPPVTVWMGGVESMRRTLRLIPESRAFLIEICTVLCKAEFRPAACPASPSLDPQRIETVIGYLRMLQGPGQW